MSIFPFILACTLLGCIFEPPRIKSRHARGFSRPRHHHERRRTRMTFKCFIYDGPRAICSTLVDAENAESAELAAEFKFIAFFPNVDFTRVVVYPA